MTKSKKMLALVIALVVMLVAVSGTLIAVLVASHQNAQSKVHVKYTSSDVNVKVEAKYYVGSTGTDMVDKSNSNAKSIELDANKSTGSLDQPSNDAVELSKTNNKIIYEYKFTNLSDSIPAKISQLTNDNGVVVPKDSNNNVKLTYTSSSTSLGSGATSDATTLNTQGLPASSTRYVYVIVSIVELLNDVDFEGTFGWDLAKGTTASLDTTGSGNSIVNVNTSQTGFYNAAALQNIDLMIGVENQEPDIYPMIANKCFTGWYTNSALTTKAVFPMVITADTKLYPKHETATGDLEYKYSASGYTVGNGSSAYKGSAKNIIIPDVYNDGTNGAMKVSSIDRYDIMGTYFMGTSIESIVVPDTVKCDVGYMFYGCTKLKNIKLSKNQSWYSDYCFSGCTSLQSIEFGNVTELGTMFAGFEYPNNTFDGSLNITFGSNSFYRFEGNCIIKGNVLEYGFANSVIPDTITSIKFGAFALCTSLSSIEIPESVKIINQMAFAGCSGLTSVKFENIDGWTVSDSKTLTVNLSATDYSANATLLTSTYSGYLWSRF